MDAGWLYTADKYYKDGVEKILTSVYQSLRNNPNRTFTQGDIYYFRRWYNEQSDGVKSNVKDLIKSGQLEIVHGGMVSSDEACTNYVDILRNFELGNDFLRTKFGIEPKIGWQLDPFGHSPANAKLFAEMGLEAMVFARINSDMFEDLKQTKSMQFNWMPEFASKDNTHKRVSHQAHTKPSIFAHVLYDHYNPPNGITPDKWYETFNGHDF